MSDYLHPEDKARINVDGQLEACGWIVQNSKELNLGAGLGIALREFHLDTGYADYALVVDRKLVGIIEAKQEGAILLMAAEQTERYSQGVPHDIPHFQDPLPFLYETTGVETRFRDLRDPEPRSRLVFSFHRPETLYGWMKEEETLRSKLRQLPALRAEGLRECQMEAITNLEASLKENRPRALIQMATGSGKTFTAISFIYKLIKFAGAKRVLFLVDRGNLGKQALKEFQQYVTPDDGRKFTELYNVQRMTKNTVDDAAKVCISTIQRVYSMLKGDKEFDENEEEKSDFDGPEEPIYLKVDVEYNPEIPVETFDFVVVDECHRSIYNRWRQVVEYFDSFVIGLTATPAKQTFGFFHQNLVMEYGHERAVADGVNVGFDVYRIKTQITKEGSKIESNYHVYKRDKETRKQKWERLDEDFEYSKDQLDRSVVSLNQIRLLVKTFRQKLFTDIFPGRSEVPKTLIFAKDDSHANDIVQIVREEFGKGNDFCKKVTYKVSKDEGNEKPEEIIQSFRNSYNPRVAVTVDMIATGTDIKPLEIVFFMRDIRSRVYFEQMKGRGTRTIADADLKAVTGDARSKTHFVIVDGVGVCESNKQDSKPMEKNQGVGFDKLIIEIALGKINEDKISSLAGRLARIDRGMDEKQRSQVEEALDGKELKEVINGLISSIDPEKRLETARLETQSDEPDDQAMKRAGRKMMEQACQPFDSPKLRALLSEIKKKNEQVIDDISQDKLLNIGYDEEAKERANEVVGSFKKFIKENRSELTALQIFYSRPYGKRHLTFEALKELADQIERPPYLLTTDKLWHAYEQLDSSKVKGLNKQKIVTDLVSVLRYTLGDVKNLTPFEDTVNERFAAWISEQKKQGVEFSEVQMSWLEMIKSHISASLQIKIDDLGDPPFHDKGGAIKAYEVFGNRLDSILKELNERLAA